MHVSTLIHTYTYIYTGKGKRKGKVHPRTGHEDT